MRNRCDWDTVYRLPAVRQGEALQPITPDVHGVAVLLLTVVALYLFTRDTIPLESSSLAILIILTAGFNHIN